MDEQERWLPAGLIISLFGCSAESLQLSKKRCVIGSYKDPIGRPSSLHFDPAY